MKKSNKVFSAMLAVLMLFTAAFIAMPAKVDAASVIVYVSPDGSDSAAGTRSAPFATITKAFIKASQAGGGTIVVMGNVTNTWHNPDIYQYPHTGLITFTGKDPVTGTIYSDAALYYTGVGLHGPTAVEYIRLEPNRSSLFINTCGHPFTIGMGVSSNTHGICIHDGVGETSRSIYGGYKKSVDSTNLTLNGGSINSLFLGGGYPKAVTQGVNGDVRFTVNGGHVSTATIGFNTYFSDDTDGKIGGNVIVTINGGNVRKVNHSNIVDDTVGGYAALICNNGTIVSAELPLAKKGQFIIYSGRNGTVEASDTAGLFKVTPNRGFYAVVNGEAVYDEYVNLPQGTSEITYIREGGNTTSKAAYANGYPDGTFRPDKSVTRAEATELIAKVSTTEDIYKSKENTSSFTDISVSDWYYSAAAYLEYIKILPEEWINAGKYNANTNITRGEFVYMLESLLVSDDSKSTKLFDFSDVLPENPYYSAITHAAQQGTVMGYENGTFRPYADITRAEAVTLINRYAKRLPNTGATADFSDTNGHWAQEHIAAAASDFSENKWTVGTENSPNKYVMPEGSAKEYVVALYDQSEILSGQAIRDGVDVIAEQMKNDILNTPNTLDIYGDKVTGKIYYISEKSGWDTKTHLGGIYTQKNTTASQAHPLKTVAGLANITLAAGDAVLFERGGVYRGQISAKAGVVYGSYGTGNKPLILQSKKNYADPALWVETEYENVWKCTEQLVNVGVIGFDHDMQDYSDASYNELYGKIMNVGNFGFTGVADLNEDLQFYSVLPNNSVTTQGDLYLYSTEGNPGERFSSIEIGERKNTFSGVADNVVIDNLSFKFTGAHAMGSAGGSKNRTVTNCVFSWLGGSVLSVNANGSAVNYGNAVEIYGACDGYFVENNWMYQIYDTAVTHQRSASTGNCIQKNIRYTSNLMEYVHWGIEFYNAPPTADQLNGAEDTYTRITSDVIYRYNVLRNGGYGWGSIVRYRQKGARLYCGASLSENYDELTEYNILDRCAGYLVSVPKNSNEDYDKNIYIQTIGCTLGTLKGTTFTCGYDAHTNIKGHLGDDRAVVVVVEP